VARLQGELGDWAACEATLKTLATLKAAPQELTNAAHAKRVATLCRAGLAAEAKLALEDAVALGEEQRNLFALSIATLSKLKELQGQADQTGTIKATVAKYSRDMGKLLDTATNETSRALGFSLLGEVYLAAGQPRDALWSYLFVETVYHSDLDIHVYAIHRLIPLFEQFSENDGERSPAATMRAKLATIRSKDRLAP
jgi:hypothetical protein